MDREKAKKQIWDNKSINTISKVECDEVIDQIFDALGESTCAYCMYFTHNELTSTGYIYCDKLEIEVPDSDGFGCTEMNPLRILDDIQD